MYATVMIYWQLNKLTGRTGQWMALGAHEPGVFGRGWIPINDWPSFSHICSLFVGKSSTHFFNFTAYVSKCWVFLVFRLGWRFFLLRAIQLRWDKRNSNVLKYNPCEQISLRTSIWEFNHFFPQQNIHTLQWYTRVWPIDARHNAMLHIELHIKLLCRKVCRAQHWDVIWRAFTCAYEMRLAIQWCFFYSFSPTCAQSRKLTKKKNGQREKYQHERTLHTHNHVSNKFIWIYRNRRKKWLASFGQHLKTIRPIM